MATDQLVARAPGSGTSPKDPSGGQTGGAIHRVVLVDPREPRRAVMQYFVDHCDILTVVGLAADLDEAIAQIRAEQADVALVEIQMPLPDGLATIAALRSTFPDLRIVVCSFHNDPETRDAALSRGADGYLAKPPSALDLLRLVAGPPPAPPAAVDAPPV